MRRRIQAYASGVRLLVFALAIIGCNSSSSTPGAGDGACVTPVVGAACSPEETPCFPGGCTGYDWSCAGDTHVWEQVPTLHKPCQEAGADAGGD